MVIICGDRVHCFTNSAEQKASTWYPQSDHLPTCACYNIKCCNYKSQLFVNRTGKMPLI